MSPVSHVIASALTSAGFAAATHSVEGTVVCFLSGIFIDIDHHFDLWLHKKKILLNPRDLFHFCEKEKDGKLYLIFHSYELLALLWFSLLMFKWNMRWWGLASGISVHLILDQIFNPLKFGTYFWVYRFKNKFAKEAIFPPKYYSQMQ